MSEAERVAFNESIFRDVNERVENAAAAFDVPPTFVCECARVECMTKFAVAVDEYQRVRRHPRRFIVAPGHEQREFERVIDVRDEYLVVEKIGEAGNVAEDKDPRRRNGQSG